MAQPLINPAVEIQNVQGGGFAGPELWSSSLNFDERECALTADHRVNTRSLVPAALLLTKAQTLLNERQGSVAFRDIRLLRPIAREDMNEVGLCIRLHRGSIQGEHNLEIASEAGICAQASVVVPRAGIGVLSTDSKGRSAEIEGRFSPLAEGWYEKLAISGNAFGESLQLIREILLDTAATPRVFKVRIAPSPEPVCVLDACFHAVLACDVGRSGCYVLHSIGALDFAPAWPVGQDNAVDCEVTCRPGPFGTGITADLYVTTNDGELAFEARGVSFIEIESADSRSAVAVAANFGAEPLKVAVDRLGRDLGVALSAAPYDQVCQSLLRAASAFDRQDFTELFLFLRLQAWWKARPLEKSPEYAAAVECGGTSRWLPNGLQILELNRYETDYLYREIFDEQVYWQAGGGELRPGDVVLDVGANIGLFSLNLLERCPGARIVAFEPSPLTAAILRANLQGRGEATIEQKGVGAERAQARFRHYAKSTVFSGYSTEPDADARTLRSIVTHALHEKGYGDVSDADLAALMSGRLNVTEFDTPVVSISDVIDEHGLAHVALLKIDAEKSEMAILRGIRDEH
ncbi:MAG TPA: FkbM family methyltransferase, partial [Steroidobacteraceae bacterium]|nr:FkbM family methyltransferase [Steroidobacteraceae bacterium]